MHIADDILKEIEENKIADIFSESEKTKVLLQLKELDLIDITEKGVVITEEGKIAREKGIRTFFRVKKEERAQMTVPFVEEEEEPVQKDGNLIIGIPMLIFLILVLGLGWMLFAN